MNTSPASISALAEDERTYDPSLFPRPSVTTDIVLFTVRDKRLSVLLSK